MRSNHTVFKWITISVLLSMFFSSIVVSPSVYAQEGDPPTATEIPVETDTDEFSFPTVTPTPMIEEEMPLEVQRQEPSFSPFQSLEATANILNPQWPAFNISSTEINSIDSSIATDSAGNVHMVWVEKEAIGHAEVYYALWDNEHKTLSASKNISVGPSPEASTPQLITDSEGRVHIVWEDVDANDVDIMYSRCEGDVCTAPVNLSGPPDRHCGGYPYPGNDLRSEAPVIGIDQADNLMVVWRAYDWGFQITQTYSTWPASGTPPTLATGCAPFGGNLSQQSRWVEHHRVMGGATGNFGLVFVSRLGNAVQVYYSQFMNGSWSSPVFITDVPNPYPDIFLDATGQAHVSICAHGGIIQYWNSNSQTLEDIPGASCYFDAPIVVDSTGLLRILWEQNGQIAMSEHHPQGWSAPVIVNEDYGYASRPDASVDANGFTHSVWQDNRNGNLEIYYSFSYSCEGIEPATVAGQAVLEVLKNSPVSVPSLNYCKNQVEDLIYVPARNGGNDSNEAFKQWSDLIKQAKSEVAFTTMFWDEEPGEVVLQGVKALQTSFEDNPADYPNDMTIRILLGVRKNILQHPFTADQRDFVLEGLRNLDIPIYEFDHGRTWRVEVGLYRFGDNSTGTYSHVKMLVVDNNQMIVSGYMPTEEFQTTGINSSEAHADAHDFGLKISGPIAANGSSVFDSLWDESDILCTEGDIYSLPYMESWDDCHHGVGKISAHFPFTPIDDDIVLPLLRDHYNKTADTAIAAAIASATDEVLVMQNRVGVPGAYIVPLYDENGWLPYAEALIEASHNPNTKIHIIVSGDYQSIDYNSNSMLNFLKRYYDEGGTQDSWDLVRYYRADGYAPKLHAKVFLVDGDFLVVGSQNFDHSAFGENTDEFDLVEYSVGIEKGTDVDDPVSAMQEYFVNTVWPNSGLLVYYPKDGGLMGSNIQQLNAGDVALVEPGTYEINETLNIPAGVTFRGSNVIIKPSASFSGQSLVKINGDDISLDGLIIQNSSGYGVEIGDGSTVFENVNISNMVFENNGLGGIHVQSPANGDAVSYTIENNTFVGDQYGVTISANANSTGVIRNNIFAGQNVAPIHIASANDGTVEYSYNLFHDCAGGSCASNWKSGDMGAGSSEHDNLFDMDPLFIDPAVGDYQLAPGSPAIDAGDPGILNDMLFDGDGDGQVRMDMGAFEYYGDLDSPIVQSIDVASADPTYEQSVNFTVTFSEPVTGVDLDDFALTTTDISDAAIISVSGAQGVYTVEVNTGTGDGTVRLDLPDTATIFDLAGNPLSGLPYMSGDTSTVIKSVTPTPTATVAPPTLTVTPSPTVTASPEPVFEADEFDGPELAAGWEWYVPQPGPTYSLTAVPGALRISLPAEQSFEHWVYDDSAPQLRRTDLDTQDWSMEARLEAIHAAPEAGYWAALEVGFNQMDQLWYGMVDDGYLKEGKVGNCCSSFQFYESLPVTLRLEKHGENYTYFFKHDEDVDWTELTTQNYPGTPTYVGLIGRSWNTGSSDLEMDWSYFHFERVDTPNVDPNDVIVHVLDTNEDPQEGLKVYAFNGATYTGIHGVTDDNGEVVLNLPDGSYRFRADLNGTRFWSAAENHCDVPDCDEVEITVSVPIFVSVLKDNGDAAEGVKVYAFDDTTYTGYHQVTDENGEAHFTLPQGGDYRFRADYTAPGAGNSVQYWSTTNESCDNVLLCAIATVEVADPVTVTVSDTHSVPAEGLKVYAFDETTYTGYHLTTDESGQVIFTLPQGDYRFRADLNGTQFWSGTSNHCEVSGCENVSITVSEPVTVTVQDTENAPQAGLKVYAFKGIVYTGYSATTDANGQVTLTLPLGSYRFRADLNGTQFWSGAANHCDIPDCDSASVTVTNGVVVSVQNTDGTPQAGLKVYAFNGTTYTGYSATTNSNGQVALTLPLGSYRFRADLNGTQFWSEAENHCDIPGCGNVNITVTKPVSVTVLDTDGSPQAGLKVYAFNNTVYTGYTATTNANGQVVLTLPLGSYRFRADLNGTQFWSGSANSCEIPDCGSANIVVSKPITVSVNATNGTSQAGLKVYVFNGSTYTGYNGTTNSNGQVTLTLPLGSYRFRADLNGTQFWSAAGNHCSLPGCEGGNVIVTIPITVTIQNQNGTPLSDITVYAFNGTTYTGYNKVANTNGQVMFTLPLGNYRFRATYNNTQFWSGSANHCTVPGCITGTVTIVQ